MRISVLLLALACALQINAGTVISPLNSNCLASGAVGAGAVLPFGLTSYGTLNVSVPNGATTRIFDDNVGWVDVPGCSIEWTVLDPSVHVPGGLYDFDLQMTISSYTIYENPAATELAQGGWGFDRQLLLTNVDDPNINFQNNQGMGTGAYWSPGGSWNQDFDGSIVWPLHNLIPAGNYDFLEYVSFTLLKGPATSMSGSFQFQETDTLNPAGSLPQAQTPEPGSWLLLAGGAGLILVRKFRG